MAETEKTVNFLWVCELVLNYKLHQHVAFLTNFCAYFRKIDTQNKGFITASYYPKFLKSVDPSGRFDHQSAIYEVSTRGKAKVHFSDAVVISCGVQPVDKSAEETNLIEALNSDIANAENE